MARQPHQQTQTPTAAAPEVELTPQQIEAENRNLAQPAADEAAGAEAEAARVAAAQDPNAQQTQTPSQDDQQQDDGRAKPFDRNAMMESIAVNHRKDTIKLAQTTPDVRDQLIGHEDDGAGDAQEDRQEPVANQADDDAQQQQQTPADDQAAPQGARVASDDMLVPIQMQDGRRVLVPAAQVADALKRGFLAEQELQNRNGRPAPAAPSPDDGGTVAPQAEDEDSPVSEAERAYVRALQIGTEDEAAIALRKLMKERAPASVSPQDIDRRIQAHAADSRWTETVGRAQGTYGEIYSDPEIALMVGPAFQREAAKLGKAPETLTLGDREDLLWKALDHVHAKYVNKGESRLHLRTNADTPPRTPAQTPAPVRNATKTVTPNPVVIEQRRTLKSSLNTPPVATQPASFAPPPQRQSASKVIADMRKSRGQVA